MSRKRMLQAVLVLGVLTAAAAGAVIGRSPDANATLAPGQRAITVTGSGTAKVAADSASWSFGVLTIAPDAAVALTRNSTTIGKVIAALKAAGVAAADLRTESVSLSPSYGGPTGAEVNGFQASNSVSVTVRDVRRAARLVSVAAGAGANQIYGPNLTTASNDAAYQAALEAALNQARDKARFLADRAGVAVGAILELVEGAPNGVYVPVARGAASDQAAVPLQPGQTEIQAQLTVTFAVA